MLHTYHEQIEEWGWHFEAASDVEALDKHRKGARNAACKFQVDAVPCILGVDLTAADLEEFIHQVKRSPVRCLNLIDLQVRHLLLHTLGVVNEYFN
jgi:hypothetical protein